LILEFKQSDPKIIPICHGNILEFPEGGFRQMGQGFIRRTLGLQLCVALNRFRFDGNSASIGRIKTSQKRDADGD
jgi:hypothetical protein